ncbi:MAG TPA: NAD(P)H-binding protein [Flavihumibacter sp.]|nr:NAD(P)H-binding protein [Bacteroidota bacterium]HQD09639.1 NAD(P)H-binding protein [Flavihumibacter sp.]
MKKVIVIGATGSLAKQVIETAADRENIQLTLFVRNKRRLPNTWQKLYEVIEGDAMEYESIEKAITGHDVVYVNLAGNLEPMAMNIVKAMKETGVNRIIAISSIGIYNTPVKSVLLPYRKLADIVENSGLTYTILRPDWFTDADEIDYTITKKGEPEIGRAISRKSIATFVTTILESPDLYKNENLGISKP